MASRQDKTEEALKVFVRVRPPIYKEVKQETAVSVRGSHGIALSSDRQEVQCSYNHVFNEVTEQREVFERVKPLLSDVLTGVNACIFAYGQTSAGKSFTMIGPNGGVDILNCDKRRWGILPRASEFLLGYLNEKAEEGLVSFEVKASFLQIYNENLYDLLRDSGPMIEDRLLLNERNPEHELKIREVPKSRNQPKSEVFVAGLSEFRVQTSEDILRILAVGTNHRMTRSTDFNATSSRSHAILQLTFDIQSHEDDGHITVFRSKLNLVDLAGSEKIPFVNSDMTNNAKHMKELSSINKSLSCLGNVISALSSNSRTHIPYRDSKLTRILQDSLSGNTRTVLIACVAPTVLHTAETLSTLQFADRAKSVMLSVKANTMVDDKVMLSKAQNEIARLKTLLAHALKQVDQLTRARDNETSAGAAGSSSNLAEMQRMMDENEGLRKENKSLKKKLKEERQYNNSNISGGGGGPETLSSLGVQQRNSATSISDKVSGGKAGGKKSKGKSLGHGHGHGHSSSSSSPYRSSKKDLLSPIKSHHHHSHHQPHQQQQPSSYSEAMERSPGLSSALLKTENDRRIEEVNAMLLRATQQQQQQQQQLQQLEDASLRQLHEERRRQEEHSFRVQQSEEDRKRAWEREREQEREREREKENVREMQQQQLMFVQQEQLRKMQEEDERKAEGSMQWKNRPAAQPLPAPHTKSDASPTSHSTLLHQQQQTTKHVNFYSQQQQQQPQFLLHQQQQQQQQGGYSERGLNENPASSRQSASGLLVAGPAGAALRPSNTANLRIYTPASANGHSSNTGAGTAASASARGGSTPTGRTNRIFLRNNSSSINNNGDFSGRDSASGLASNSLLQHKQLNQQQQLSEAAVAAESKLKYAGHAVPKYNNGPSFSGQNFDGSATGMGKIGADENESMEDVIAKAQQHISNNLFNQQQEQQQQQQQQAQLLSHQQPSTSQAQTQYQNIKLGVAGEDIGKAIEMFSFRMNRWDKVSLVDFEPTKRLYKCQFLDGSSQWLDLSKKPVRELA